ncbi:MAG: pitrilysin family protein [Patescibacteria group bacterium]
MFKQYRLKNDLRVLLAPLKETKAVTVLVLVKVGSRYEPKQINGASHFVEHLMFKGTEKRPTSLDITKKLDGIGASYNAFTSKDHTGYYVKCSRDKIELALDVLSDIVFNSKFDTDEIERERGVIVEEINMYEDAPMMMIDDVFEGAVFGRVPLGRSIAGPKEVIKRITRKQLYGYYREHYQPRNMLIAVAGNYDYSVRRLIRAYFGGSRVRQRKASFRKVAITQRQPRVSLKRKETEQAHLALGFPAYSYTQRQLYALYALAVVLGGNMSSRLFMSIRERKGLCYYIRTDVGIYEDTGTFAVFAGLDKSRIREAIREIVKELKNIRDGGITAQELKKAKDFLRGKLILDLEASDSVASWLGKQALLKGTVLTAAEQLRRVRAVTMADVRRAAREVIQERRCSLSLIGPFKNERTFRPLLKM